jgi:hypothetical protein
MGKKKQNFVAKTVFSYKNTRSKKKDETMRRKLQNERPKGLMAMKPWQYTDYFR